VPRYNDPCPLVKFCDLEAFAADGKSAFEFLAGLFDQLVDVVHRRTGIPTLELELEFADARRDAERWLYCQMHDTINLAKIREVLS